VRLEQIAHGPGAVRYGNGLGGIGVVVGIGRRFFQAEAQAHRTSGRNGNGPAPFGKTRFQFVERGGIGLDLAGRTDQRGEPAVVERRRRDFRTRFRFGADQGIGHQADEIGQHGGRGGVRGRGRGTGGARGIGHGLGQPGERLSIAAEKHRLPAGVGAIVVPDQAGQHAAAGDQSTGEAQGRCPERQIRCGEQAGGEHPVGGAAGQHIDDVRRFQRQGDSVPRRGNGGFGVVRRFLDHRARRQGLIGQGGQPQGNAVGVGAQDQEFGDVVQRFRADVEGVGRGVRFLPAPTRAWRRRSLRTGGFAPQPQAIGREGGMKEGGHGGNKAGSERIVQPAGGKRGMVPD
jgi:hypothetical protein